MVEEIALLMQRLSFPEDAISDLCETAKKILENEAAHAAFCDILLPYEESKKCAYGKMFAAMKDLSEKLEIREYAGTMILLLAMCKKLKERYAERGLSDELFYHTMEDLRYKNEECRLLYGQNGTFVASWYPGFYKLERFAFGRLQFGVYRLGFACRYKGETLLPDYTALDIHIPRTGTKLDHDEVLKSYQMAKEFYKDFYKDLFKDQPAVFTCHTWMLYPWNLTVLSPKSNMYAFYKDFEIIDSGDYETHKDAWRLFDCLFDGDASKLPRDSSLRRAYADRIANGEPTGWGLGIFVL